MKEKKENSNINNILRELPSVDFLSGTEWFLQLEKVYSRSILIKGTRNALDKIRQDALLGKITKAPSEAELRESLEFETEKIFSGNLKKVINGTGVVLHTNLGRAPLCQEALNRIRRIAEGYSNLEFNLEAGNRGSRHSIVEALVCELTGAEGAMVVNNNAAAITLALSELTKGKEVVVSRGQLVEIGGSFRVPDVMAESGAIMKEVGTTNKTKLGDFKMALTENTGAFVKIHTSNFKICGFTEEVDSKEMVDLAHESGIFAIEDLGSGCLLNMAEYGLPYEPTVQEALSAGMDIVTFSGDKLLGGPQAGIIAGKRELVERIKKHPLARAFRMDKLTLAALEGTLLQYLDTENALKKIPTLRMLTKTYEELLADGKKLIKQIRKITGDRLNMTLEDDFSEVGGGSMPLHRMKTVVLALKIDGKSPDGIATELRTGSVGVVGRISKDRFLLDVRTILEEEFELLAKMLAAII